MGLSPNDEKRKNSLANLKPLKSYADCTDESEKERIKEIATKGGKATQECLKKARTFKDVCNTALTTNVSKEKAKTFLGDDVDLITFDEKGMTDMQTVLSVRAMRLSADGNAKFLEFVRDTSGQSPKTISELQITADIMTDNDRALIDKLTARMSATDGKP